MYKDPFTGRYHTHYRDFDPITNRWNMEDPAGYADGLNLYASYMGVNGRDVLGLDLKGSRRAIKSNPWNLLNIFSEGNLARTIFNTFAEAGNQFNEKMPQTYKKIQESKTLKKIGFPVEAITFPLGIVEGTSQFILGVPAALGRPVETGTGLYQFGKTAYNDPVGTGKGMLKSAVNDFQSDGGGGRLYFNLMTMAGGGGALKMKGAVPKRGLMSGGVLGDNTAKFGSVKYATRRQNFIERQTELLNNDIGYNISPISFYEKYTSIGRSGTFISDARAFKLLGNIKGSTEFSVSLFTRSSKNQISFFRTRQLERQLGLERQSLRDGFRLKEVNNLKNLNPRSPLEGNDFFRGSGQGLPNGAPEIIIDSIPTNWQ
jgi:hypothetical protein